MNTTVFMQMSHANCAMKASDMAYEIETLRRQLAEERECIERYRVGCLTGKRQLAEKDAEIERLKEEVRVTKEEDFPRKAEAVANNWRIKLASSQLREEKLREALDAVQQVANRSEGVAGWHMNGDIASWDSILPEVEQALALPADDTALREMIEKAGEVMRERCAKFVKQNIYSNQTDIEAIRALPGVTLENLQ